MNMKAAGAASSASLGFTLWVVFAAFLDNNAQQPLVSPYAVSLGASAMGAALVVGSFSVANMAGNLLSAPALSRLGQRRVIALGLSGAGLVLVLYQLARAPLDLALLRLAHGLAGGLLVPAVFCHLADSAPGVGRGRIMGRAGAVIGLTAIIGPPAAGLARHHWGPGTAFALLGLVMLTTGALVSRLLAIAPSEERSRSAPVVPLLGKTLSDRRLHPAYISAFTLMFTMGMLGYRFPLQAGDLGYPGHAVGMFFSVFAIPAVLVMALSPSQLSDRHGRRLVLMMGLLLVIAATSRLDGAVYPIHLGLLMLLYGTGFGLVFPAMNALVVDVTKGENRRAAFAIFHTFFSMGVIVGPVVGGLSLALGSFARASVTAAIALAWLFISGRQEQLAPRVSSTGRPEGQ